MLKITFDSSNTWGRRAKTTYQWLKPCRGNWAVPVLINGFLDSPQTPLVRDATDDWQRNFPSCSFATFSAPCAVAVGKETWEGRRAKARRRSRPAFAGLGGRRHTQRARETDSRAGDGVSEPVPGWREQACGTLHWSWSTLQSLGYDPLSLPLSDCNHGDEGAKGPALRPLIFSSPSLALSLPLTLAPCTRDFSGLSCLRNPCGIDDPSVWSSLSLSVPLAPLLAWLD